MKRSKLYDWMPTLRLAIRLYARVREATATLRLERNDPLWSVHWIRAKQTKQLMKKIIQRQTQDHAPATAARSPAEIKAMVSESVQVVSDLEMIAVRAQQM
jgi:hypothetical protein